jgi:hypothetical protein
LKVVSGEAGLDTDCSLSCDLAATIAPGFGALAFEASHGVDVTYESTKIRKGGSRFPAIVPTGWAVSRIFDSKRRYVRRG